MRQGMEHFSHKVKGRSEAGDIFVVWYSILLVFISEPFGGEP